ncbi:MAG: ATP-dependent 6-phosphofructokinase [Candidatus Auribacter fodinae]|jgi:6-phosphofructokinase 1|uniref:ATP-dependent 6-phosphofructokinase n=1 Tax=Candidatus Auribacter fodinae TaxID=2093366 RepID=A0A3A4R433_9BACT|nr:MAG: ATP-dependent 6-phosphofructokinase [Candidatus Auribacter fodinae]
MSLFDIPNLGIRAYDSPLPLNTVYGDQVCNFTPDTQHMHFSICDQPGRKENTSEYAYEEYTFETAGPRKKIFFDPTKTTCAIVTCGGLSPGLNNVIQAIVFELYYHYRVKSILGIRYGYEGLNPKFGHVPMELKPEAVRNIAEMGGTILGSSRGNQAVTIMADEMERLGIDILFTIGGDGTQRGAYELAEELKKRGQKRAVVGIPKTIDNDIVIIEKSFGFETAFSKACEAIQCAHTEAVSAWNGVGLVKVMGRHSGYIAAHAALALNEVNFVLVPEVKFELDGEKGLLNLLRKRLELRHHAVIIVAEGAGQDFFAADSGSDASGNVKLHDIGTFLTKKIGEYLKSISMDHTVKYIDPSYMIRSIPAIPSDALFSSQLARHAVHAGMTGKTAMLVGWFKNTFIHLPLCAIANQRKTIDPESHLWFSVLEATGQPMNMINTI